ncbi:head-tail connector protein [Tsuneonella mangrovi]|uniref:head-tail connector protein n=1 Tax=Tsuneonella mangrovi TaxID=1982042 RepID=UPI000BA1F007|nr:hypothetical protein [Tsuneonella mangrovi]
MRTIVIPAPLPGTAVDDLKAWLAIGSSAYDGQLTSLLRSALDTCEAFTGLMPITAQCTEILPLSGEWQSLVTRPVQSITSVIAAPVTGSSQALAASDYEVDIDADGTGLVRVLNGGDATRIFVSFSAGVSPDWTVMPEPIRQGVIRLAAHHWREREDGTSGAPPASVAALWRPFRRMRLA